MNKAIPLVSIVGRPNVGKSTLFNRLIGRRLAIVDNMPGVTRDRIFGRCDIGGIHCHLVDTGGLSSDAAKSGLDVEIKKQIMISIDSSAFLVFVTDIVAGVMPEDRFVADILRKRKGTVVLAANKADSPRHDSSALEFHELGLGEPVPVSAQHDRNIGELIDRIAKLLPPGESAVLEESPVRFCIIGRPNVGKSSITNAILGEERCVVSPIPGTTRDRVDTDFTFDDRPFIIVDTAGMKRRKSKMDDIEYYGYNRARRAMVDSDISVLVLDAEQGLLEGDKRIASFVQKNLKGFLIAVNKMDLIGDPDYDTFLSNMFRSAPFMRHTPVIFISALESSGMDSMLNNIIDIHQRLHELMPLELLKTVVYDTRVLYSTRSRGKRTGEILGVIHDRVNPPRVIIKVNDKSLFQQDYIRLIENRIRAVFNLSGVPLDLVFSDPKKKKKK